MHIFTLEIFRTNKTTLQETNYKRSCSCKWIDDIYIFIGNVSSKFFLQDIGHTVDDKINNFHWSIDNSKLLNHFWESILKETVVKFNNYFLSAFSSFYSRSSFFYRIIESVKGFFFFLICSFNINNIKNILHAFRNRVICNKLTTFKKGLKNRFCNYVLSKHFNCRLLCNRLINVLMQTIYKF